jgi:hypothetical protein
MQFPSVTVKVFGRMDNLWLFKPQASKKFPDQAPSFRGNLILDPTTSKGKESIEKLEAAVKQVNIDTFKKHPQPFQSDHNRFFMFDGDANTREVENKKTGQLEDVVRPGYAGMKYIKCSSKNAPDVRDADKTKLEATDGKPYNGCYGYFVVNLKGYDKGSKGMSAYLEIVQFIRDGEVLGGGGRVSAEEALQDESEQDDDL